jgi:polyisoprenoid-binding protein YceI
MKKQFILISVLFLAVLSSFVNSDSGLPTVYQLTPASSKVTWVSSGTEDGKSHNGEIKFKSGTFQFDVKTLLSGFCYIDMQSINCKDVTDEGFNKELMNEMRSEEQLNLYKYKEATFKVVKAKRLDVAEGQPNYEIEGTLKLKGIDIPTKFTATVVFAKSSINFKSKFKVEKATTNLPYDLDLSFDINAAVAK